MNHASFIRFCPMNFPELVSGTRITVADWR